MRVAINGRCTFGSRCMASNSASVALRRFDCGGKKARFGSDAGLNFDRLRAVTTPLSRASRAWSHAA